MTDAEVRQLHPARIPLYCALCSAIPTWAAADGRVGWCNACLAAAVQLAPLAGRARLNLRGRR
jgi:hypothetical protein